MDRALLREELAALAHEQWSGWMNYLFRLSEKHADGTVTIPAEKVARWERQCATPYAALPTIEQLSDQMEADRVLAVVDRAVEHVREGG